MAKLNTCVRMYACLCVCMWLCVRACAYAYVGMCEHVGECVCMAVLPLPLNGMINFEHVVLALFEESRSSNIGAAF